MLRNYLTSLTECSGDGTTSLLNKLAPPALFGRGGMAAKPIKGGRKFPCILCKGGGAQSPPSSLYHRCSVQSASSCRCCPCLRCCSFPQAPVAPPIHPMSSCSVVVAGVESFRCPELSSPICIRRWPLVSTLSTLRAVARSGGGGYWVVYYLF